MKNTVDDAIKNLKTAIDNKADTTASVTSENPADIKVDKEAPVGNTTNYKLSLGNDAKAKLAKAATALQTVEGDSNITATKDATDPTKVKLALNKNLTADSLTLGNTAGDHAVVNKDGLTIANGPSVKKEGINAGDKVISGVADGNIAAGSKEAVNGGQLAEVKSKADSAVQKRCVCKSDRTYCNQSGRHCDVNTELYRRRLSESGNRRGEHTGSG